MIYQAKSVCSAGTDNSRVLLPTEGRDHIEEVIRILDDDGVILFPTDTVWGIGGITVQALKKIRHLKGRDAAKPMARYFSEWSKISNTGVILTDTGQKLARAFLPGPLTLVLPLDAEATSHDDISRYAGMGSEGCTAGIRIPDCPWLLRLLARLPVPMFGSSANISGCPDPENLAQAMSYFGDGIDVAIESDLVPGIKASTVVDACGAMPVVLREGAISSREIMEACNGEQA